jgi:hypothetical protein
MSRISRVEKIVELARGGMREDAHLRSKHQVGDLGLTFGNPAHISYMADAIKLSDPLKKYLESLDQGELMRLETIMYFGRDPEDVHGNNLSQFKKMLSKTSSSKEEIVRNMSEKAMALELYFSQAFDKAQKLGLDLNANF